MTFTYYYLRCSNRIPSFNSGPIINSLILLATIRIVLLLALTEFHRLCVELRSASIFVLIRVRTIQRRLISKMCICFQVNATRSPGIASVVSFRAAPDDHRSSISRVSTNKTLSSDSIANIDERNYVQPEDTIVDPS